VVWAGAGAVGSDDGWVALCTAEAAPMLLPDPVPIELSPLAGRVRDVLNDRGAMFFRQIADALGPGTFDEDVVLALWDLVWGGLVTNDTLAPLRALIHGVRRRRAARAARRRRGRGPAHPSRLGPPTPAGRWALTRPR